VSLRSWSDGVLHCAGVQSRKDRTAPSAPRCAEQWLLGSACNARLVVDDHADTVESSDRRKLAERVLLGQSHCRYSEVSTHDLLFPRSSVELPRIFTCGHYSHPATYSKANADESGQDQRVAPGFWYRRKHLAYYTRPGGNCTPTETPPSPTTHIIDYLSGAAIQCASMKTGFKFPVLKAS